LVVAAEVDPVLIGAGTSKGFVAATAGANRLLAFTYIDELRFSESSRIFKR
jgi:hypothetical protein